MQQQKTKFVILLLSGILFQYSTSFSQTIDTNFRKNELGIDVANALTFLKKNNQSYLINYWYSPSKKMSYRAGLNIDIGNGESDGNYPSVKIGVQKNKRNGDYNFYYGIDFSYTYFKANTQPNNITRIGFSPLIGVEYCFNKNFSLTTEASLNYFLFNEVNDDTFNPIKEKKYYRLVIGSVGMVVLKYRFD